MSRLKLFHFSWCDAWFSPLKGYDTILESSADGKLYLKYIVDMNPESIELTGREDELINCIEECGITKLNGNKYIEDCLDGFIWQIDIAYDDKVIRTRGDNAYPSEFWGFMDMMCKKWHMKKSELVGPLKAECKKYHSDFTVEPMSDSEQTWASYTI